MTITAQAAQRLLDSLSPEEIQATVNQTEIPVTSQGVTYSPQGPITALDLNGWLDSHLGR